MSKDAPNESSFENRESFQGDSRQETDLKTFLKTKFQKSNFDQKSFASEQSLNTQQNLNAIEDQMEIYEAEIRNHIST